MFVFYAVTKKNENDKKYINIFSFFFDNLKTKAIF